MPTRLAAFLAALALVVALAALVVALRRPGAGVDAGEPAGAAEEPEELAHLMAFVQRHAEKLYFAGTNDHAALAQFYVHELEETFEAVEAGGYVENGHALDSLVAALAHPALEGVERAVAAQALSADAGGGARARALFEARYAALVEACNRCHETTAHGYVRIVVPEASGFPSQDFRPSGADEDGG